ncbi:MAG TPA: pyridoxamine 5'-phosphate oxidase family protein [Egibacteraceae bacterium]|nr:pyridoxamine 5'-phosphate oxidase family protein [Egibacteraceae bacterium]
MSALTPHVLEALSVDECLQLLATRSVGRIAFAHDGDPQIFPVNYQLHEGAIVFRTDYGGLLDAIHLSIAAFEVDAIDPEYRTGWSVVVHGRAEEVWKPAELVPLRTLNLRPWAPGARDHYVRIFPRSITGRRIK